LKKIEKERKDYKVTSDRKWEFTSQESDENNASTQRPYCIRNIYIEVTSEGTFSVVQTS
jgi:hypothetical protein